VNLRLHELSTGRKAVYFRAVVVVADDYARRADPIATVKPRTGLSSKTFIGAAMTVTNQVFVRRVFESGRCLGMAGALAVVLTVSACNKSNDGKTAGQKLDSAIAKTEQAAADAKAKTETSMAKAGSAMKDATSKAEASGKSMIEKAAHTADDAAITARLSSNLAKDPDLKALQFNVDTRDGAVTLTGTAPTEAVKEKAASIAKGVKGVNSVDNKLVVKPG
jgi:hyperosmotically inducible periplasmic protein